MFVSRSNISRELRGCRISRLEFLDETEELDLVLAHYAISWGILIPSPADQDSWSDWRLREKDHPEEEHPF